MKASNRGYVKRVLSVVSAALMLLLSVSNTEAQALKITKIPSNCGYIESAHVSYYQGRMYVEGWLKSHYWTSNKIYVQVDIKDAQGKVIATKTSCSCPTGRPQSIAQFGVSYLVSFDAAQIKDIAAIDITYIN